MDLELISGVRGTISHFSTQRLPICAPLGSHDFRRITGFWGVVNNRLHISWSHGHITYIEVCLGETTLTVTSKNWRSAILSLEADRRLFQNRVTVSAVEQIHSKTSLVIPTSLLVFVQVVKIHKWFFLSLRKSECSRINHPRCQSLPTFTTVLSGLSNMLFSQTWDSQGLCIQTTVIHWKMVHHQKMIHFCWASDHWLVQKRTHFYKPDFI